MVGEGHIILLDIDIKFPTSEVKPGLQTNNCCSECHIPYPVSHEHAAKEVLESLAKDVLEYSHYHPFQVTVRRICSENRLH